MFKLKTIRLNAPGDNDPDFQELKDGRPFCFSQFACIPGPQGWA